MGRSRVVGGGREDRKKKAQIERRARKKGKQRRELKTGDGKKRKTHTL